MKRIFAVIIAVAAAMTAVCRPLGAAEQDAGYPGAYLNFIGGARANAMGRTFTALADGADAVAWNASGLGYLRPNTVSFMHLATMESASLSSILYAQPLFNWGGFGLGYARFDSGYLPIKDELNRDLGDFRDLQETYMAAYGLPVFQQHSPRKFLQSVAVGGTFKFSKQSLYNTSASGWGLDAGALAKFKQDITLGVRVQNLVAPALKFETATDTFPRIVTVGAAKSFLDDQIIAVTDIEKAVGITQRLKWSLGVEGLLWKVLKLRGGYNMRNSEFTFGLGYAFGRHEVHYAANTNTTGLSHNLGLTYSFGGFPVTIQASPESFSPVGLKKKTTFTIRVTHPQRIYGWTLDIKNQDGQVARSYRGSGTPPSELSWDGSTQKGLMVAAGNYIYTLQVVDAEGKRETTPPQIVRVEYGTPLDMLEMQNR